MAVTPQSLSLTPAKLSNIPPEETLIEHGEALLESTLSWKQGKTFNNVKTFSRLKGPEDGAPWYCRVSEHGKDEATFDQLWAKLGKDKAQNEKEFIPDIKKVTQIKYISPTQSIWSMYYTFPPPVSPRVFTVLQVVRLNEFPPQARTGLVISIPIDLTSNGDKDLSNFEEKGVRGRYVSVERIKELEDGRVEWRMATSSTPGGLLPNFIVEKSMPSKIAIDVPHFMKWLRSLPEEKHDAEDRE